MCHGHTTLWDKMPTYRDRTPKKKLANCSPTVNESTANLYICNLYLQLIEVSCIPSEITTICGSSAVLG